MSEQKRILEMIEKGQITAQEGMDLLNALKESSRENVPQKNEIVTITPIQKKYRFMKVKVISDDDNTKVNVNIPLKLIKSLGGLTSNISAYIPESAKDTMNEQGINLDEIDILSIIEAIEDGSKEGSIIDIVSEENGVKTVVQVYVE